MAGLVGARRAEDKDEIIDLEAGPSTRFARSGRSTRGVHLGLVSEQASRTEEVRFELTRPLRAYRFSRPAHSAALPLLRRCKTVVRVAEAVNFKGSGSIFGMKIGPLRADMMRLEPDD